MDEVLLVVPQTFPHKEYFGATQEERLQMLSMIETGTPASVAVSEQGLFIDIARECRSHYDESTRIYLLCGRDAAERILNWDYGRAGVLEEMFREFELLVAGRSGDFQPPSEFRHRIHSLALTGKQDHISSTEVRDRIARGEPWEHLVPEEIVDRVREIYS